MAIKTKAVEVSTSSTSAGSGVQTCVTRKKTNAVDSRPSKYFSIMTLMEPKLAYPKMITRKLSLSAFTAVTLIMTSNLAALGLGALEVKSNLDQPLDGTIELRVAPGDELSSVRAAIASREDFEKLGIDYPSYLSDMSLSVEDTSSGRYVLRVVSNNVVIKEPFIHFLVRVDYSGGSFLREYTALIDPPVYAAEAPVSIAEPRAVGIDQSYQTEKTPEVVSQEFYDTESYQEPEVLPEAVDEVFNDQGAVEVDEFSQSSQSLPTLPRDAQYGPVGSGESLSVIASELQRQFPDLSIYQIMQVLFEENRGAFLNDNINGLMKGAVLKIGDLDSIRQVEVAAAKQFFSAQVSEWDPSVFASNNDFDDGLRVGQDEYSYDDSITNSGDAEFANNDSFSSANDAFQVGASQEINNLLSSGDGESRVGEVLALQQQISQMETSLASSYLENQELTERISLLEGQLADMNRLISLDVESADLAAVESTLAQQNSDNSSRDEDAEIISDNDLIVVGDSAIETTGEISDVDSTIGSDDGFIDPLAGLNGFDADEASDVTTSVLADAGQDSLLAEELSQGDKATSVTAVASATTPISSSKAGFFDDIKLAVFDTGLWKIIAGAGALLLGGLALWFVRRRRADEEFEISMMSIESLSQIESADGAATVPQQENNNKITDRETSFLTVYSDSDAVVQADEVDPVAEADVYIAYGRDEQAEEVLLDGIASKPTRVDIKQKLLSVYHKNNNIEGFERIAEELYSQKNVLTKNVWEEVSSMGKDLAPENPLFDVSASDLIAESESETDNMITKGDMLDFDAAVSDDMVSETAEAKDDEAFTATDTITTSSDTLEFDTTSSDTLEFDTTISDDELSETVESADSEAGIVVENNVISADELTLTEEDPSINLINFSEDVSELDQVAPGDIEGELKAKVDRVEPEADIVELAGTNEESAIDLTTITEDELGVADSVFEIDISGDADDSIIIDEADDLSIASSNEFAEIVDTQTHSDVSDLEMDEDYDDARTQYELAKVFVDLGDEDGARKILDDIVANDENSKQVLDDAGKLLASINA